MVKKPLQPSLSPFEDKRRLRRIQINLPVRVRWTDAKGVQFEELSRSIDVNANGALLWLRQRVRKGIRLRIWLPLPRSMQKGAALKAVYETKAVVVRVQSDSSGAQQVAVRFRSPSTKSYYREAS